MKNLVLFVIFLAIAGGLFARPGQTAFDMNRRLGRGINMGNAFEAPSETAWGNPWKPEYFRMIRNLGFSHVRLPVRWEPSDRSSATEPYTIYPAFLNRIKQVVDSALKNQLHIIINMHHHDALIENPAGQKPRFLMQWKQISEFFSGYSDSLLFEVLNEPNGALTPALWNQYFSEALQVIRQSNPNRTVLLGTANWGGLGAISQLQLPQDQNLILTIHYYNPFRFTHQGAEWSGDEAQTWLGTKYYDTETDRQTIQNEFTEALAFSQTHQIPIHIGEFGAYEKADLESRVRWTTYLARWFEQQGFSWAYWEFSAGFGIYKPSTGQYLTKLVDALLHKPMPEPAKIETSPVYISNFTAGSDGWNLFTNGGASAALSRAEGKLKINISSGGTESWHVQLVKSGIPIVKGFTYRVSFRGASSVSRNITAYTGNAASPWNAYSDYNQVLLSSEDKNFAYTFVATVTDPAARVVFDLGNGVSGITITDVKVETIVVIPTAIQSHPIPELKCYPNPVLDELVIENPGNYSRAVVITLTGVIAGQYRITAGKNRISTAGLNNGLYLLRLEGEGSAETIRFIRRK